MVTITKHFPDALYKCSLNANKVKKMKNIKLDEIMYEKEK